MDLIYLHGAPASGKLTIARQLEARLGCGVFHNHLTIEVAKAFFPFDTPPFWRMVAEVRLATLRAAAHQELIGFDLNEVSTGQHTGDGIDSIVGARALYKMCNYMVEE